MIRLTITDEGGNVLEAFAIASPAEKPWGDTPRDLAAQLRDTVERYFVLAEPVAEPGPPPPAPDPESEMQRMDRQMRAHPQSPFESMNEWFERLEDK